MVESREIEAGLGVAVLAAAGFQWLLRLVYRFGGPVHVWESDAKRLRDCGLGTDRVERFMRARESVDLERTRARLEETGSWFIPYGSDLLPPLVRELHFAPGGLSVAGRRTLYEEMRLAPRAVVVGTRRASAYAHAVTSRIVVPLIARGAVIVSGMAMGVDTFAHKSALDHGGLTIAVLGCGTDVVYPARNRSLRHRILEDGLLVSEFPPGTRPAKWTFPLRNRIMAAFSHAVVVVEAGVQSGALITVEHALELGRAVFAVPGSILCEGSRGVNGLIHQGATPIVDTDAFVEEFLCATRNEMNGGGVARPAAVVRAPDSPGREEASSVAGNLVLQALCREPRTIDEVARHTGLEVPEVTQAIGVLELRGLALPLGPGRYAAM